MDMDTYHEAGKATVGPASQTIVVYSAMSSRVMNGR